LYNEFRQLRKVTFKEITSHFFQIFKKYGGINAIDTLYDPNTIETKTNKLGHEMESVINADIPKCQFESFFVG
jgi:hypothetical protein